MSGKRRCCIAGGVSVSAETDRTEGLPVARKVLFASSVLGNLERVATYSPQLLVDCFFSPFLGMGFETAERTRGLKRNVVMES